ncbi:hypothetical protein NW762_004399 [Fusarium torreyae]|uniref:Uncharacterized protein n=1 Tax=Fusarium torreyae TaxID=1237075 RepID=A0A9W8S8Y0_9HYPO|nr:hypothetical protein NW762_004399 [Fusarium torreyae]
MPGPPTPVSRCPLVCLEIHDGVSARAYSSSRPHNIFTLTIEGERRIETETGTLVLLIHREMQQVVSLRLRELGGGLDDVVSIDKQARRMCVRIPGKTQAILTQFEEKRDFNVAVCLLQKAGFFISEAIPTSLLSVLPSAKNVTPDTPLDVGPRLSSIAPLSLFPPNNVQGSEAQPSASFTEMLNASYQYTPLSSTSTPDVLHTQRTHSLPMSSAIAANQMMGTVPSRTHFNPYNMFLGYGNNRMHMPRVGSPLRHSFNSKPPPSHTLHDEIVARSHEAMSPSGFRPSSSPAVHHAAHEVSSSESTPEHSQKLPIETSRFEVNSEHYLSPKLNHHQPSQGGPNEFRDLMPRPRKLPFESDVKTATLDEALGAQANTPEKSDGGLKQKKLRKYYTPNVEAEAMSTLSDIQVDNKAQALGEQNTDAPKKPGSSFEASKLKTQFTDLGTSSWVVLADAGALKDLDQATTSLFEQYETDVANGGDKKLCAEFYMNQIWMKRKEVWLGKLQAMTAR